MKSKGIKNENKIFIFLAMMAITSSIAELAWSGSENQLLKLRCSNQFGHEIKSGNLFTFGSLSNLFSKIVIIKGFFSNR